MQALGAFAEAWNPSSPRFSSAIARARKAWPQARGGLVATDGPEQRPGQERKGQPEMKLPVVGALGVVQPVSPRRTVQKSENTVTTYTCALC
jgi:hypothetical protein